MNQYAIEVLFSFGIWGILFVLVPKSRKPIMWASFASGAAEPISQYGHIKDYWNPSYLIKRQIGDWIFGIVDYIFAFDNLSYEIVPKGRVLISPVFFNLSIEKGE